MKSRKITVAEVRASINSSVKMNFVVRWFGRPLANLMTPMFYNSGWTADSVTYFRTLIAGFAFVILMAPSYWLAIFSALLFYLCFILDCVDGNLARLRQSVTFWGKFIDGLADFLFILGAPFAVGISLAITGEEDIWLMAGAAISIASLTSQMVRNRLSFMREWMVSQSGPINEQVIQRTASTRALQSFIAEIYVTGTFFAPLLLMMPDFGRKAYILLLLLVQLIPEILWTACTIREAGMVLDRPRRSIHAAVPNDTPPPDAE